MTEARLFSRHSIGTRIAALFMLLILVITAAMTYVSISVSTNELLDSSTEYTEQLIRRVNAELDMYVEYMKDISDFIVDNGAVAAYLRAANEHRLTDAACREAQEQLAAAQKIRSEITAIALIPESGGALFGSRGCVAQHLFQLPECRLVPGRAAGTARGTGFLLARGKPDRGPVQLGRFVLQGRARPRRKYAGRSAHRP